MLRAPPGQGRVIDLTLRFSPCQPLESVGTIDERVLGTSDAVVGYTKETPCLPAGRLLFGRWR